MYDADRPTHDIRKHLPLLRADTHAFLYEAIVLSALRGRGNDFGQYLPFSYQELELELVG